LSIDQARQLLPVALQEARTGFEEGGADRGSLFHRDGRLLGRAHGGCSRDRRCTGDGRFRNAAANAAMRQIMVTTLAPAVLQRAIRQFNIRRW